MKIEALDFLILGLAVWRATSLLVKENGPWNVFAWLRARAGIVEMRLGDRPEVHRAVPDTFLAGVLDCVWCCSMWTGGAAAVLYFFSPEVTIWFSLPLALSAVAVWIETRVRM